MKHLIRKLRTCLKRILNLVWSNIPCARYRAPTFFSNWNWRSHIALVASTTHVRAVVRAGQTNFLSLHSSFPHLSPRALGLSIRPLKQNLINFEALWLRYFADPNSEKNRPIFVFSAFQPFSALNRFTQWERSKSEIWKRQTPRWKGQDTLETILENFLQNHPVCARQRAPKVIQHPTMLSKYDFHCLARSKCAPKCSLAKGHRSFLRKSLTFLLILWKCSYDTLKTI